MTDHPTVTFVHRTRIQPPQTFDQLPVTKAEQPEGGLFVGDLVRAFCDRLGLDPDFVSEIRFMSWNVVSVRVQLQNDRGRKYVRGTDADPRYRDLDPEARAAKGATDPQYGKLAEHVVTFDARITDRT